VAGDRLVLASPARQARLLRRSDVVGDDHHDSRWTRRDIQDILKKVTRRKVLVTLDDALVRRLDHAARERGVTRSALLATLTERELRRRMPEQQREIEAAIRAMRKLGAQYGTGDEDAATTVRSMRDERGVHLAKR
jgi:hypothetical protein